MLEHKKIKNLEDYFVDLSGRPERGVYFYRMNGYSKKIEEFIKKYDMEARRRGVVLEGKIQNPDENQLSYYAEIMGMDFKMDQNFLLEMLQKWLPRMKVQARENVAGAIFHALERMQKAGKTENMLKNAYIKFMCWFYYKFERIVNQLGEEQIPKILYEGNISLYECMILSILSNAGCDIVLLQYQGDESYRKCDPQSVFSDLYQEENMQLFPEGFCLKALRKEMQALMQREALFGTRPRIQSAVNVWIQGKGLEDIRKSVGLRGTQKDLFYNCFYRIYGVADRLTYVNELFLLQQEIKNNGRKLVIVNEKISIPTPKEIADIRRSSYRTVEEMVRDLSCNIRYVANEELQRVMHQAFVEILLKEAGKKDQNLNKLTNKAVYLLCWLRRYMSELFANWRMPQIGCFIHMGACTNENEALFLRFLAFLPVDVLILCPNQNTSCLLEDERLYEITYPETLSITDYPEEHTGVKLGTAAYHAERDLDTLLYQDSGMYRNQQYGKSISIHLQTMYEEIKLLWDQELKYRPGFCTMDDIVNIPVIFAKISGVKDGNIASYWESIKELITEDTFVIKNAPFLKPTDPNPMKSYVAEFYKNGKLQRNKIKTHEQYPYGILREEMQEHMLDKLQDIIEQKRIKGIGQNGTEYTVLAQILHLPKEIVRMIQKFDLTKKNPKVIYINTGESCISLEDTIMITFLNRIGFDILFFVPTGYQNIEKYFSVKQIEEHQIGAYEYDLQVPDLQSVDRRRRAVQSQHSFWRDKIFRR